MGRARIGLPARAARFEVGEGGDRAGERAAGDDVALVVDERVGFDAQGAAGKNLPRVAGAEHKGVLAVEDVARADVETVVRGNHRRHTGLGIVVEGGGGSGQGIAVDAGVGAVDQAAVGVEPGDAVDMGAVLDRTAHALREDVIRSHRPHRITGNDGGFRLQVPAWFERR